MNENDRLLGMDKPITRRDFLDGVAVTAAGAALAATVAPMAVAATPADSGPLKFAAPIGSEPYPPMRTGLRGFDPDATNAGHSVRDGKVYDSPVDTGETYDLIVVGAGMSGLSAAYFYRKQVPKAKILIIDACDDFGGHARRNEFNVDGRQLIIGGGTYAIWYPGTFTVEGKALLADIGIDAERYYRRTKADAGIFERWGLQSAVFFNKEEFGADRLVNGFPGFGYGHGSSAETFAFGNAVDSDWPSFLAKAPFSARTKRDFIRLYTERHDYLPGLTVPERVKKLRAISYNTYLLDCVKVDPAMIKFNQFIQGGQSLEAGAGPDSFSAWRAYVLGLAGFTGMELPGVPISTRVDDRDAGEHIVLPDGNGGVSRLLIRWLIPESLPGSTMEDSVAPRFNYDALDKPGNNVRIRLSTTAYRVRHKGDPPMAKEVEVTYLRDGKPYTARAGAAVLSCFNAIVPYLCPELPEEQKAALHMAVRKPLVVTNVAVANLQAFKKLGVSSIFCPGEPFSSIWINSNPGLGDYELGQTMDEPAIIQLGDMNRLLTSPGLPPRDQHRAGRAKLLATSYETIERAIREQLARVLGPGGFDPARDVRAIIINRWSHGYATGTNDLFDPVVPYDQVPWVQGRKRFGRIVIANSDSAGICLTQAAFAQSNRAIHEIFDTFDRPTFDTHYDERG